MTAFSDWYHAAAKFLVLLQLLFVTQRQARLGATEVSASSSSSSSSFPSSSSLSELPEYRDDFCYNRTFSPSPPTCSWNYLPRLATLSVVDGASKTTTEDPTLGSLKTDEEKGSENVRLMILMQNGRVGSTWLVKLLNTVAKRVKCEGEGFDSNPCKNDPKFAGDKYSRWESRGIEKSVFCASTFCSLWSNNIETTAAASIHAR